MKRMGEYLWLGAFVVATIAGCGGNVIVENKGGSSTGGSSTGGSSTGGSSTGGTSTGGSTSSGNPVTYCGSICNTANQFGCLDGSSVSECVSGCLELFGQYPDCQDELVNLYDCAIDGLTTECVSTDDCNDEAIAYSECAEPTSTCGTDSCAFFDEQSCSCQGSCNESSYSVDCKNDGMGIFCSCQMDGKEIGGCYDASLSCDMFESCCSAYFFGE